jgi:O-succinylbenzoic acid--CoA ligase
MERGELAARLGAARPRTDAGRQFVEEEDPRRFMDSFAKALSGRGDVFLVNPSWPAKEREGLARLPESDGSESGWLMIPSGGTSGGIKFARHDARTIASAVKGFQEHFGLERVHAMGVLPLHHVSGFMAWMRCALTGGRFIPCDWKTIESGRFPAGLPSGCCLSLVPTQLQRLLHSEAAVSWLRSFRLISLGGGPAWDELLESAARLGLPLAPSYGATETAAMVASLRPGEFLAGRRGCGMALPHVHIRIDGEGLVRVKGESLFRGYFPDFHEEREWAMGDLGRIEADGSLFIVGRTDDLIITGGKKVAPAEVEAALRLSGEFEDVAVIGLPDSDWGQQVVACHPGDQRPPDLRKVEVVLSELASFKRPKRYAGISPWPRNAQGKIDRAELVHLASRR